MKKGRSGPAQRFAFSNNYRTAFFAVAALLTCLCSYSQVDTTKVRQSINATGYNYKNVRVDSSFGIPRDTFKLRKSDSGALAWKNKALYGWNGNYWDTVTAKGGTGGGGTDGNNFPSSLALASGTLTLGRTGLSSLTTPVSTTDVTEGTNPYFTNARARGAVSAAAGSLLSYNLSTGVFTTTLSQAGADSLKKELVFKDSLGTILRYASSGSTSTPDTLVVASSSSASTEGFGIDITSNVVSADTGVNKVATWFSVYDSIRVQKALIQMTALKLQSYVSGSQGSSDAVSAIKLLNGNIRAFFHSIVTPNLDNSPGDIYYTDWNGRVWSTPAKAAGVSTGFLSGYTSEAAVSVDRNANGNIYLIFQAYASESNAPFYMVECTNETTNTWGTPAVIFNPTRYSIAGMDRILTTSTGVKYYPFSENTNGVGNNNAGNFNGRYLKSTNGGLTWTVSPTVIFAAADSLLSEPFMYETYADLTKPLLTSNKKLVYGGRSRSGFIVTYDSVYGGGSWVRRIIPIRVANATVTMKAFGKQLFAFANKAQTGASTQTEFRKQLSGWVSNNGVDWKEFILLAHNTADTIAYYEPSVFFDDNSMYLFYSDIWEASGISELYVRKVPRTQFDNGEGSYRPWYSALDFPIQDGVPNGGYSKQINMFSPSYGENNAYFRLGSGSTSPDEFEPAITTLPSNGHYVGTIWNASVGLDGYAAWYSAGLAINVTDNSGSTLTAAMLMSLANNGTQKFAVTHQGTVWLGSIAGDPSYLQNGMMWYNSTTNKLRTYQNGSAVDVVGGGGGGGASALDDLTDVTITSPSNGQYLKYNGSAWVNANPPGGNTFNNGLYDNSGTVGLGASSAASANGKLNGDRYVNLDGHSLVFDATSAGGDVQISGGKLIIGVLGGAADANWKFAMKASGANTVGGMWNDEINTYENIFEFRGQQSGSYAPNADRWIGAFQANTGIAKFGFMSNSTTWAGGAVRGIDWVLKLPDGSGTEAERARFNYAGLTLSGYLKTGAPSGGTAANWKLGTLVTTSGATLDGSQYVELEINGVTYKLATVVLPEPKPLPQNRP